MAPQFLPKPAPKPAPKTEPTAADLLDEVAEATHAKYGAELFTPRTRVELRGDADTMYRAGLLKKYLPKEATGWTPRERYNYATARALIAFLAGAELGLLPLQAVRGIYFVEDQPSPAAKTLVGLIKKRTEICEYWVVETSTDTECTIVTKRRGSPKEERLTVTIDQFAKSWREEKTQYGHPKRPPWVLWPSRQLHARCSSWLAGQVYQDITLGFYAAEEMSSAAWERKYSETGSLMGGTEGDADLEKIVGSVEGGPVEPPLDPGADPGPGSPPRIPSEYEALVAQVETLIETLPAGLTEDDPRAAEILGLSSGLAGAEKVRLGAAFRAKVPNVKP